MNPETVFNHGQREGPTETGNRRLHTSPVRTILVP